jgi:hypothetical protein
MPPLCEDTPVIIRQMCFGLVALTVGALGHGRAADFHATSRAAPGVIIFSGRSLVKPVVLSDWIENQRLMSATVQHVALAESALARRPKIQVAMYWGAEWSRFASTPDSLAMLRQREAQAGVFYPAVGTDPAVFIFGPMAAMGSSARAVSDEGIAILRAHHVPVAIK